MIRFAENLNKMINAGLGGALDPPRTEVAVGHRVRYMDASGPVATFETNIVAPIRSLRVDMQPIQDLNGQDAPYPAGGGKNLLYAPPQRTETSNGVTWTINADGSLAVSGTATEDSVFKYITSTVGGTFDGDYKIAVFPLSISANIISCGIWFDRWFSFDANKVWDLTGISGQVNQFWLRVKSGQTLNATLYPMIYKVSETVTAWSPYSNICPITGRDSVRVWRESAYDPNADPALTVQLGQTVYGGTVDVTTGVMKVDWANIASYDGETLPGEWISDCDVYSPGTTPTTGAQVCYKLAEPLTVQLSPQTVTTLLGQNSMWSDAGNISLEYPYYEETEGY